MSLPWIDSSLKQVRYNNTIWKQAYLMVDAPVLHVCGAKELQKRPQGKRRQEAVTKMNIEAV